jgi:tetratricopeptide (TPR) repeat protein
MREGAAGLLALLVGIGLLRFAGTNLWSMEASKAAFSPTTQAAFPPSLVGHPRSATWTAIHDLDIALPGDAIGVLTSTTTEPANEELNSLVLGRAYEATGQVDRAAEVWKASGAWPEIVRAAERSVGNKRWSQALAFVDVARQSSPREVVGPEAKARRGLGEPEAALTILQQAITRWPTAPELAEWTLYKADSLSDLKRWTDAEATYQSVTLGSDAGLAYWGYLGAARAENRSGQGFDKASAQVSKAIALFPNRSNGYSTMADLLRAEGRKQDADLWELRAKQAGPVDQGLSSPRSR